MATRHLSFDWATRLSHGLMLYSGAALAVSFVWASISGFVAGLSVWTFLGLSQPIAGTSSNAANPFTAFQQIVSGAFSTPSHQHPTNCSGIAGRLVPRVWHDNGCLVTAANAASSSGGRSALPPNQKTAPFQPVTIDIVTPSGQSSASAPTSQPSPPAASPSCGTGPNCPKGTVLDIVPTTPRN